MLPWRANARVADESVCATCQIERCEKWGIRFGLPFFHRRRSKPVNWTSALAISSPRPNRSVLMRRNIESRVARRGGAGHGWQYVDNFAEQQVRTPAFLLTVLQRSFSRDQLFALNPAQTAVRGTMQRVSLETSQYSFAGGKRSGKSP